MNGTVEEVSLLGIKMQDSCWFRIERSKIELNENCLHKGSVYLSYHALPTVSSSRSLPVPIMALARDG